MAGDDSDPPEYDLGPLSVPSGSYGIRVLYCYSLPDVRTHDGLVKIGQTSIHPDLGVESVALDDLAGAAALQAAVEEEAERAAQKRIKQQTGTASIRPKIHWVVAVSDFDITDTVVRAQLEHAGYPQVDPGETGAREWRAVSAERAREVVDATIAGLSPAPLVEYVLREEQERFVASALNAWIRGDARRLWDAKMRFGKTLTAFEFIAQARQCALEERCGDRSMDRVLILTHRPVVGGQWFDEFTKVLHGKEWKAQGWSYGSKLAGKGVRDYAKIKGAVPFVYFASMQDLRGRDGNNPAQFKESNREIFEEPWDLVIIDEAHEGNETQLADEVHDALKRNFTLYLSGTPYKIISENGFAESELDSWDYPAEQEAKERWRFDHPSKPNPYAGLPKLWILALDMADTLKVKYEDRDDIYFDFGQMFKAVRGKFDREEDVVNFLSKLSDPQRAEAGGVEIVMPFATDQHPHTLWTLPSVESCKAMKALLEEHPFFQDYTVLNVAGSKKGERKDALNLVKSAISKPESRTITLTVGRLTTGVTVPEWTAVLMLSNMSSAQSYMQTIFRVQSPHEVGGRRKTDCFVYDFDPDRVLQVLTDASGASSRAGTNTSKESQEHLDRFLHFLPVISKVDAHDFRRMDAAEISRAIKRIYRERVIKAGFDSPLLFVRDFSHLDNDVREAVEEVRVATGSDMPDVRDRPKDITVTVSDTGIDQVDAATMLREQEEFEAKPKKERTPEEQADYEARKTELDARENMRRVLKTISVRIPLLVLARMSHGQAAIASLRDNFSLVEFVHRFDDESWREFFQEISKSTVLRLEPAFDRAVLQIAIRGWVDEVLDAFALRDSGDWVGYRDAIAILMGRIRNPNKETVFTPWSVVGLVYHAAGFADSADGRQRWIQRHGADPTFYDINIKSGLFPLYAATHLAENNPGLSWQHICDLSIFGNARTQAGKWIACTLLGQPIAWPNITVIDICTELQAADIEDLSDDQKQAFVTHFLTAPLRHRGAAYRNIVTADIHHMPERDSTRKRVTSEDKILDLFGGDVRFDHVISNPPYQMGQGGNAKQIYDQFFFTARQLARRICMIFPLGWQKSSGKAAGSVRHHLIRQDRQIVSVDNYYESPSGPIRLFNAGTGGVNILVWVAGHNNGGSAKFNEYGQPQGTRDFTDTSQRFDPLTHQIIEHLNPYVTANGSMKARITGRNPFGVRSLVTKTDRPENAFVSKSPRRGHHPCLYDREDGEPLYIYIDPTAPYLKTRTADTWKTVFPLHGAYRVWNDIYIVPPESLVTDRFILIRSASEEQARNWKSYLRTDFVTALINETAQTQGATQHALRTIYEHVPDISGITNPRTGLTGPDSDWTDGDLRKVFKLNAAQSRHLADVASRYKPPK